MTGWRGAAETDNSKSAEIVARRNVDGREEPAGGRLRGDNKQLSGNRFTGTFAVAGGEECRFIRLVNIDRNHFGSDQLVISAWEIFGTVIE
jgi:hypothetical protein